MTATSPTGIVTTRSRSRKQAWCRASAEYGPGEGLSVRLEVEPTACERDADGFLLVPDKHVRAAEAILTRWILQLEERS